MSCPFKTHSVGSFPATFHDTNGIQWQDLCDRLLERGVLVYDSARELLAIDVRQRKEQLATEDRHETWQMVDVWGISVMKNGISLGKIRTGSLPFLLGNSKIGQVMATSQLRLRRKQQ